MLVINGKTSLTAKEMRIGSPRLSRSGQSLDVPSCLESDGIVRLRLLRMLERTLVVIGLCLLGAYAGARIHRFVLSEASIREFEAQRAIHGEKSGGMSVVKGPDFHLWSPSRIREYEKSLSIPLSQAVAILRIPKIQLEVPVLDGTDDVSLNRAVGLIAGTSRPGDGGNLVIAGHRDGFFRGL
jgi:sortase A